MNQKFKHPADLLVELMNRVYYRGMTTTSGGNFSMKDEDGNIWITPSGIDKGTLTREDIVKVAPNGERFGKHNPSCELPFHTKVYEVRPDMKAVFHAHPPALVSISLLRRKAKINLLPTFSTKVKKLDTSVYDIPGSIGLGEKISKVFAAGSDAVMMENHGIVVCGTDLYDAFKKFEAMETAANLTLECQTFGKEKELNRSQIKAFGNVKTVMKNGKIVSSTNEIDLRNSMVKFSQRSYHHRLFDSTEGIYAVREDDNNFLIMADDVDRKLLEACDIVKVQNGVAELGKKPSRYSDICSAIFAKNKAIGSVAVAQPVYAMAFGATGHFLDSRTIPESYINMRDVVHVKYDDFVANPLLVVDILSLVTPIVIVDNALVFVVGANITKCFDSLEVTDFTAKTLLNGARLKKLGAIQTISDQEVEDMIVAFNLPR